MRTAFINALVEAAEIDERVALVVGDLGFGVVERFSDRYPERYVNAGVAEQDMVGLAAGMAMAGAVPFTYSIVNFSVLRCLEQIRNDVCYHQANVKLVAVGGGLAYGALGVTHHGTEDLAILRSLPEMRVIAPADPLESAWATRLAAETPGPFFLRLGRNGERQLHPEGVSLELGRAAHLREGTDVTLIGIGSIVDQTLQAAEILAAQGVAARVLSMHTLRPLDVDAIHEAARTTRAIVTVEEHSVVGGLGGAVAEVLAERSSHSPFRRVGLPSEFVDVVGSQDYLRAHYGLTPEGIADAALGLLNAEAVPVRDGGAHG